MRMENFFFSYGKFVAKKPVAFIILCIVLTLACGSGIIYFEKETTGTKLWIPSNSAARLNTDWLWDNFPPTFRYNSIIFESEDILTPEVIQTMYRVRKKVDKIKTEKFGDKWKDMCQLFPVVKPPDIGSLIGFGRKRKKRQDDDVFTGFGDDDFFNEPFFEKEIEEEEDNEEIPEDKLAMANYFSSELYPDPYCNIVKSMDTACFEMSILELWANDGKYDAKTDEDIETLTREDILDKINNVNRSGIFLVEKNFTDYLSGVTYDDNGRVIGAKATIIRLFGRMNATAAKLNPAENRGENIDPRMLEFEGDLIQVLLDKTDYPKGLNSYANVMRSFGDIAGSTILGDIPMMGIGYMIVFVYVMVMLGKFNCVEQRAFLSISGIVGVIFGIVVSYGLCSFMGLFFGPMHSVLPFLLLGIGKYN